jgi:hypothetical protein
MLTLLFYESALAEGPATAREDIEDALLALPGVELAGESRAPYRAGRWRDLATGASCTIDLGTPPIEEDTLHPPRAYDGWTAVAFTIGIPLAGPHWLCVEALQFTEGLLAQLPQLQVLDSEDSERGVGVGPGVWNRPRLLASWERQHAVQQSGRSELWRMNRLSSVCLWRYRRERALGLSARPQLHWPEAFALLDREGPAVRSAAFWNDDGRAWALPPVEMLIINQGGRSGVLVAADLAAVAGAEALPMASAALVTPSPVVSGVFRSGTLLPTTRFRALGDLDWSD